MDHDTTGHRRVLADCVAKLGGIHPGEALADQTARGLDVDRLPLLELALNSHDADREEGSPLCQDRVGCSVVHLYLASGGKTEADP